MPKSVQRENHAKLRRKVGDWLPPEWAPAEVPRAHDRPSVGPGVPPGLHLRRRTAPVARHRPNGPLHSGTQ